MMRVTPNIGRHAPWCIPRQKANRGFNKLAVAAKKGFRNADSGCWFPGSAYIGALGDLHHSNFLSTLAL